MARSVSSMFASCSNGSGGAVVGFEDVGQRVLQPVAPAAIPDAALAAQLDSASTIYKFTPGAFTSVSVFSHS